MHRNRRLLTRLLTRRQLKILSLLLVLVYLALRAVSDGTLQDRRHDARSAELGDVASGPTSVRLLLLSPLEPTATLPGEHCDTEACRTLLDLLEHAERKIDFAIYGIRRQPKIFAALVAAQQRGVEIRGVVDRDKEGKFEYADTEKLIEALQSVRADALSQKTSSQKSSPHAARYDDALMHNKFFVVDERWVWTSSANLSDTDLTGYNANLAVVIDSPEVAAQFTHEVDQMYERGLFHRQKKFRFLPKVSLGQERVQVFFPPRGDAAKALLAQIRGAREQIDVAAFYLTHKDLARDLILAHRRGVKVRVILDATAAQNQYSLHTRIRDAGIALKVENWGGKMHAKAAVIDGRFVVAGSTNWTKAGFAENDENLLILDSPAQAAIFQQWFEALWASIPERWLTEDPAPESWDSGMACTDGVDNDFDRRTDAEEASCAKKPARAAEKTLESPAPQAVK